MAAAMPPEGREPALVSLEVFILRQLSTIAQETSGRAQAQKDVRAAALRLLGEHAQPVLHFFSTANVPALQYECLSLPRRGIDLFCCASCRSFSPCCALLLPSLFHCAQRSLEGPTLASRAVG